MLVTLVIRLRPEQLAAGEFVGEVEHVGDGGHTVVNGLSDLLGFAQRAAVQESLGAEGDSVTGDGRPGANPNPHP